MNKYSAELNYPHKTNIGNIKRAFLKENTRTKIPQTKIARTKTHKQIFLKRSTELFWIILFFFKYIVNLVK